MDGSLNQPSRVKEGSIMYRKLLLQGNKEGDAFPVAGTLRISIG